MVRAIDVSSAQPRDLTALIQKFQPQHVVVKLAQALEHTGLQDVSRNQIASVLANGCTVGGYMWLYKDLDPYLAVADVLKLARSCGVKLPVLWLDVETYTDGTIPGPGTIQAALNECDEEGVIGGIYTSRSMWQRIGSPSMFGDSPLWVADYNEKADLDVVLFGAWTEAKGHQYTSTPIDQSVFTAALLG